MLEKHRATLTNGHLEWDGEAPKEISKNGPVTVDVIVVSPQPKLGKPDGEKMAAALQALQAIADRGGIKSIKDPVKWQRAIRKDRPLPGR
jgi:hypothetical protein